ncbi:MAG: zinc-binding dehydrogenase, partial [Proteobacteria bacterium]|nr:zinc-binding dehydrogenase [Pseudomonadota bacterium]
SVPITGKDVLITGAGPIGLFAVAIARAHGARRVIVQEPHPYRAGIAQRLGADLVIDPGDADAAERVLTATGGVGPATILEMSGNARALNDALDIARNGAHIALLGLFAQPIEIDLSKSVIMKGITLHGVTGRRMFETWYQVEAFVANHPDAIDSIITHVLPASQYDQGFTLMGKGDCGKVVLDFTSLDSIAA